jgi:prepilin-type N-terminal cleavage/methylation domain-containing protein
MSTARVGVTKQLSSSAVEFLGGGRIRWVQTRRIPMFTSKRRKSAFTLIELMIVIAIIAILAAILVPNFIRARAQGQLTACKSNLKNIGTAMEMYSTDFAGRYATAASLLTPNYLKIIPTCASAGSDTYSSTFSVTSIPDAYTFYCSGTQHASASEPANYPQYNSTQGLVT